MLFSGEAMACWLGIADSIVCPYLSHVAVGSQRSAVLESPFGGLCTEENTEPADLWFPLIALLSSTRDRPVSFSNDIVLLAW